MSALRVLYSSGTFGTSQSQRMLMLDCWKAELTLVPESATSFWSMNGADLPIQFFPGLQAGPSQLVPLKLKFGGMLDARGLPVNLNQSLVFSSATPGRFMFWMLTRTYFDRSLVDPQAAPR